MIDITQLLNNNIDWTLTFRKVFAVNASNHICIKYLVWKCWVSMSDIILPSFTCYLEEINSISLILLLHSVICDILLSKISHIWFLQNQNKLHTKHGWSVNNLIGWCFSFVCENFFTFYFRMIIDFWDPGLKSMWGE